MKDQLKNHSAAEIEKLNREKKSITKRKEGTSKPSPKKPVLWIRQPKQVDQQVTPPIQILMLIPKWSEERSSEEEYIGMCKCRRKINAEIINEEVKGRSSEVEESKIRKFSRKSHVGFINQYMKRSSSEEEDIGIHKCGRISRVDIINEEFKGWKSS